MKRPSSRDMVFAFVMAFVFAGCSGSHGNGEAGATGGTVGQDGSGDYDVAVESEGSDGSGSEDGGSAEGGVAERSGRGADGSGSGDGGFAEGGVAERSGPGIDGSTDAPGTAGAGGSPGSGGATGTGGYLGAGGTTNEDAAMGTGGRLGAGGATPTGGNPGSGGAGATGGSGSGGTPTPARLAATVSQLPFAQTYVGETSAPQSFTIQNFGELTSSALTIGISGKNVGDFSLLPPSGSDCSSGVTTLAHGEKCTVRIVFTPTTSGSLSASVTFSAVTGGSGSVALSGTAGTAAALVTDYTHMPFSRWVVGQTSAPSYFTIRNSGSQPSSAISIVIAGANASDFSLAPPSGSDCRPGVTTLASYQSCLVRVTFRPTAGDARSASITFSATIGGSGVVQVDGTGVVAGWARTGRLDSAHAYHTATLLENGTVVVAGGREADGIAVNTTELYDPMAGAWKYTGYMVVGRESHTAILLGNGKVLVAGGYVESLGSTTSAELYDPAGNWTQTGDMREARHFHTATLLASGKVLVVGGYSSNDHSLSSAELYDPVKATWTLTGETTTERDSHTATLLGNGKVLVAGSFSGLGNTAELFDPVTETWTATGTMSTARCNHTATLLGNGKVLVVGGGSDPSAELYDPATGTWTTTGALIRPRTDHTATLLGNGKVLVAGGYYYDSGTPTYPSSTELYDPASGTWTAAGDLLEGGFDKHTATLLKNGRVLVAGGYAGKVIGELSSAYLYVSEVE
jgi:hypothetical protein